MNLTELREQHKAFEQEKKNLVDLWETENREGTAEELQRFDTCENDQLALKAKIDTAERKEKIKRTAEPTISGAPAIRVVRSATKTDEANAIRATLLHGTPYDVSDSFKRSCDLLNYDYTTSELCRNQSSDTSTEGIDFKNGSIFQSLVEAKALYGGIESVSDVIQTSNGNPIHFVISDNTGRGGTISAQNQLVSNTSITESKVTLNDFAIKSAVQPISLQLVEDVSFDILGWVGRVVGTGLARKVAAYATTGAGTTEPKGVMGDTTQGSVGVSNALVADDMYDLFFSVDPEYRNSPNCVWMMNDTTLGALMSELKDTQNRPLWGAGLNDAPGASLLGKRVVINNSMDTMVVGTPKKPVAFGDFYHHKIRYVGQPRIVVDRSRYIDYLAVGIFGWVRVDSHYVDPGNHPIKHLATGATSIT